MADRLADKVAVVIGAGQSPGAGMGNGRATAIRFAQEGAAVLAVDRDVASARETADMAAAGGRKCHAFEADVTREATIGAALAYAEQQWGRVDVLHYNVGVSLGGGDKVLADLTEDDFNRVAAINLRGAVMAAKLVLPIMRRQQSGVIINVSSMSAIETTHPLVSYRTSKAGLIAFTQQLAIQNAGFGIRANVLLPGLMDTPMAVDTRSRATGRPRADIQRERDARVPLRGRMGTAWDVANAALFLASDEAGFITGVSLPVDGGALVRIG